MNKDYEDFIRLCQKVGWETQWQATEAVNYLLKQLDLVRADNLFLMGALETFRAGTH